MNNKSIQILRTKLNNTDTKIKDEVLLDGQPFYNKTSNTLYIGDGTTKIKDLSCVRDDKAAHLSEDNVFTGTNTFDNITIKTMLGNLTIDNVDGQANFDLSAYFNKDIYACSDLHLYNGDDIRLSSSGISFYTKAGDIWYLDYPKKKEGDVCTMATTDDIPQNIKDGSGTSSLNQVQDGTGGTFSFTNKNPNATTIDSALTGDVSYGGVGDFSTSFGGKSSAQGKRSFAAGTTTIAKGAYSTAFGDNSVAIGADSMAVNYQTVSQGKASFAEGQSTIAKGVASHSEGWNTKANGDYSHAEGDQCESDGKFSHAQGRLTHAKGDASFTSGVDTTAEAYGSEAKGYKSQVVKEISYSGSGSSGGGSSSGGLPEPPASYDYDGQMGQYSSSEGVETLTYGYGSKAQGYGSRAYGHFSLAGGINSISGELVRKANTTSGVYKTSGIASLAFGHNCIASGDESQAFGLENKSYGPRAFTAGQLNTVSSTAEDSAVFGYDNLASHNKCFVGGSNNYTGAEGQFIFGLGIEGNSLPYSIHLGKYGVYKDINGDPYLLTVGCGNDMYNRANALSITQSGYVEMGKITYQNALYIKKSSKILKVYWEGPQAPMTDVVNEWLSYYHNYYRSTPSQSILVQGYDFNGAGCIGFLSGSGLEVCSYRGSSSVVNIDSHTLFRVNYSFDN